MPRRSPSSPALKHRRRRGHHHHQLQNAAAAATISLSIRRDIAAITYPSTPWRQPPRPDNPRPFRAAWSTASSRELARVGFDTDCDFHKSPSRRFQLDDLYFEGNLLQIALYRLLHRDTVGCFIRKARKRGFHCFAQVVIILVYI